MKKGDRVKMTTVKLHEDGMPHVTRYGTVAKIETVSYSNDEWQKVRWDDGSVSQGFALQGVMPIDAKLAWPEPIAYMNPVHPDGPEYVGNERVNAYSSSKEEYDRKIREMESSLAPRR